jgi:putative ABC transport system substrate-binding protein
MRLSAAEKTSLRVFRMLKIILSLTICLFAGSLQAADSKKITLILPMKHQALDEIVSGFTQQLQELKIDTTQLNFVNAHGDANTMRAAITQAKNQKVDMLIPVGTQATQMASSLAAELTVIGLASYPFPHKQCLPVVEDEIAPAQRIDFIRHSFPKLQKIALVHSSNEKVMPEIKAIKAEAQAQGMDLVTVMVNSQPEIFSAVKTLPTSIQGIFILKDHMIVSGVNILIQEAKKRNILLITSDEGTLKAGGSLALGVKESDIGRKGASLVAKILHGEKFLKGAPICDNLVFKKEELYVFLTKASLDLLKVKDEKSAAQLFNPYQVKVLP